MAGELWTPTDQDKFQAELAYIEYAKGVAILNDPSRFEAMLANDFTAETSSVFVFKAEDLMISGLADIIRYSNPANLRAYMLSMENRFDEALPHIQDTVDRTFENHTARLQRVHEALDLDRPMPLADRAVYKFICHSRFNKLTTKRLLGSFLPHPELVEEIEHRKLVGHSIHRYAS